MVSKFRTAHWILNSPQFKRLVRMRRAMAAAVTALACAAYFGYLLLVSARPGLAAEPVGGGAATKGILLALLVIVFSFALTVGYVAWANRRYDPEMKRLKEGVR